MCLRWLLKWLVDDRGMKDLFILDGLDSGHDARLDAAIFAAPLYSDLLAG